ncbi:MAG: TolC family protein [Mariprofundaceae bacterium]|nr:TolC family protein [Mariprofundaceae bacterium]
MLLCTPVLSDAADILSLKQIISHSVNHNRQLMASLEGVNQANERINDMKGKRMPHVGVSTAWVYSNSPLHAFGSKIQQQSLTTADFAVNTLNNPSYQQNYQSRLGLSLPLFAGGTLQAAQKQAEKSAQAAALDFEFQKQQKIYQVIVTYMQSLQFSQELENDKQAVKAAEKRWLDAQALQSKGMALKSDVMDAHVYVLRRQVAVDEASNAYQASLEQLALLMGLKKPLNEPVLAQPKIEIDDSMFNELLGKASEKRVDFQALQMRYDALSLQRDIAYGNNLPHVNLVAAQEWNSATPALKHGNAMVGVTVSMNLFNGGSDQAKQRQAESAYAATQWEITDQRQLIVNQVRQARRALDVAENKLTREKQVLQQTQESLRILSLRYQQGLETTSHVLDAQVAMDHSQVALLRAQSDLMIAKAALLLAAGLLNEGAVS